MDPGGNFWRHPFRKLGPVRLDHRGLLGNGGDDRSVLGCNRLLYGIAECMTDQDVTLLDARCRLGGHSDQHVHQAAQTASRDASKADCEKPHLAREEDGLD